MPYTPMRDWKISRIYAREWNPLFQFKCINLNLYASECDLHFECFGKRFPKKFDMGVTYWIYVNFEVNILW